MPLSQHVFRGGERKLGVSEKRRYDLPLSDSPGNGFLILLIALMTFLAVLALTSTFALSGMIERWSSGLENKLTIEIPSENSNGNIRNENEISGLKDKLKSLLEDHAAVDSYEIMDQAAIGELVSPWLGNDFEFDDVPLPGLVAVELLDNSPALVSNLRKDVQKIDETIVVDTHEDWLDDLLDLIGILKFSTILVTLIIAFTGIVATAGAIRSRMAEHKPDVELLHLMGASDRYIAGQFQRNAMILGLQGGACGLVIGGLLLLFFTLILGKAESGLLPDFHLNAFHYLCLLLLPVLACGIASATARITVLRALTRMP